MSSPPSSSISFPRTEEDEMEVEDNDSLSKFNLIGEACVPNFPGQNELSFLSSPGDISNFSFEPPVTSSPRKRLHNDTSRHDQDGNESDVSSTSIHSSSSVLIHKDEPPVEPFKTKMTRMVCWMLFFSVLGCMPVLLISLVVPILNIFATPTFLIFILLLVFDIAFLAYLSLAQTDPPSRVTLPFLPWDFRLALKVNLAILSWVGVAIKLVPALLGDWAVRRVIAARHGNEPRNWVRKDIHYGSLRAGKRLDVYRALPQPDDPILSSNASEITDQYSPDGLTPVIIFIHSPHLGPLRGRKWMYDSLGRNLSSLGYCVVIPDITYYPQGRTEQMVDDIRRVMKWTAENIRCVQCEAQIRYFITNVLN
ncbi:hypothetical protein FRC03_002281 [Tulasnella sp. 419]|nr:hypothetical protein FRC03_002281 [Tulasnella sp. 419]